MYKYNGIITNVVDGDTLDINVDLGFGVSNIQRFRLLAKSHKYFDAPESWRPKTLTEKAHGLEAKQFLIDLVALNNECVLTSVKRGKYRYVAYIEYDGVDLGDLLITNGFQKKDKYE